MDFDSNKRTVVRRTSEVEDTSIDQGLRSYMLKVYNYMFAGLSVTGVVAYAVSTSEQMLTVLHGGIGWLLFFAMLGIAFFMPARINRIQASTAQILFITFSVLMGASLSYIFILYTQSSVARAFFITATMFGAMSMYGYTTKKDLSHMGSILFMGLIGIVIASVVNIFMASSMLSLIISVLAVIIFTGLTAYDTQRIKEIYYARDTADAVEKKSILGAFALYLDFVNLFTALLSLIGERK